MHIILMLFLVISGMALTEHVSILLGGPVFLLGLACFNLGSGIWREKQENYFIIVSLVCLVLLPLGELFNY